MDKNTLETQQALIDAQIDKSRPNISAIYNGAKINYVNARTKVIVTCKTHGDFDILPRDIARRSFLCPDCNKESKAKVSNNKGGELKAAIIKHHGHKFDFSDFKYKDTQTQVTLRCTVHNHKTKLFPYDVERRQHICEKCRDKFLHNLYVSNTSTFIAKSKAIHGTKRYDYSQVNYQGSLNSVTLICAIHGHFEMPANSHLSGRGCKKCGYKQASMKKTGVKQNRISSILGEDTPCFN